MTVLHFEMVLDYLFKVKHFSFWNFCQIQKILVNTFLIENGKTVNSLNSLINYFGKQKMVLDYLFKFKHFSFWNFCQIQKILVNAFLIKNGKIVNSLDIYFGKQKMVLDYLFKFKHFSFWNFCQIQKYAKVIEISKICRSYSISKKLVNRAQKNTSSPGSWNQPGLEGIFWGVLSLHRKHL